MTVHYEYMTITVFRKKGPNVGDGYQFIRCDNGREALITVNRAFWPTEWLTDVASGRSAMLGTDPVITLNATFNKNGYWFLDYWDANWPKFTNEAIAQVLREHFEGECEVPKGDILPLKPSGPRPSRVAITRIEDETKTRYFDSVHEVGQFVQKVAHRMGGDVAQSAVIKLSKLEDQLALYGWVYNGETDGMYWVGTAMNYLMRKANLDDFETHLLDGIHAYLFEQDKDAVALRDLIVEGPLAVDD